MLSSIQTKAVPAQQAQAQVDAKPVVQTTANVSSNTKITPPQKPELKIDSEATKQNLAEAITRLNEVMKDGGRGINFSIDEKAGRHIVHVRNLESGEIIRQIPNEAVLKVAHSIEDLKGMLYSKTV